MIPQTSKNLEKERFIDPKRQSLRSNQQAEKLK
jgi:hypothetical protein